jgi:hypothetical protein
MNTIKKYLGLVWILLAIFAFIKLINAAYNNISSHGNLDINKPLPWIIIITIFTPIVIGMILFGWYAFTNEYNEEV